MEKIQDPDLQKINPDPKHGFLIIIFMLVVRSRRKFMAPAPDDPKRSGSSGSATLQQVSVLANPRNISTYLGRYLPTFYILSGVSFCIVGRYHFLLSP